MTKATKTTKTTGTTAKPSRDPRLPKAGTVIEREYKGKTYKLTVLEQGFKLSGSGIKRADADQSSLSAAAKAVMVAAGGKPNEVAGPKWWGLNAKG